MTKFKESLDRITELIGGWKVEQLGDGFQSRTIDGGVILSAEERYEVNKLVDDMKGEL